MDTDQLRPGDRIRITRHNPDGTLRFIKTGTVRGNVCRWGFSFADDEGYRRFVADSDSIARHGGRQVIARITES